MTQTLHDSGALQRAAATLPIASGAMVMATGIVSIALQLDGHRGLSQALMWIAIAVWLGLVALAATSTWRARFARSLADPAALTAVAGTCVLASRIAGGGARGVAAVLLIAALALWLVLLPRALRALAGRVSGSAFLTTVASEGLAVVALSLHARWLDWTAIAPIAIGLAAYLHVVARFDLRELLRGAGDQWVAGGALAIASLACAQLGAMHIVGFAGPLALALWLAAAAWVPALVAGEVAGGLRRFDVRRWATVFPLGMYAASGYRAGAIQGATWLVRTSQVFVWIALAAWLAAAACVASRAASRRR